MTTNQDRIAELRNEASTAGDYEMYAICDDALNGDPTALAECAKVLATTEAMAA